MLIKNTKADIEGVLNRRLHGFANSLEAASTVPVLDNNLVKNINGNMLGKTLNVHAEIPSKVLSIYSFGNMSILRII